MTHSRKVDSGQQTQPHAAEEEGHGRLASDVAPRPEGSRNERCAELLRSGQDCSQLNVSDIALLLCDRKATEQLLAGITTLRIHGARGDTLDLSGQSLNFKLQLIACELEELNLTDGRFIGVSLLNCSIASLKAQRLTCQGTLQIQSDLAKNKLGLTSLDGAVLGGNLEIGTPEKAPAHARLRVAGISADGIRVAGHAVLCGTLCRGELWLGGANVGRDLDLRATSILRSNKGRGLSLQSSRIGGRLRLGPGNLHGDTVIEGIANWRNLRVESGIMSRGATFLGEVKLDSAHIVGSLDFSASRFDGKVQANNMRVEGDVSFDGAELTYKPSSSDQPIHLAAGLDLSGSRITGCGFFGTFEGKPFRASAPLRMRATHFGERLIVRNAVLSTRDYDAVSIVGCAIGTQLQLAPAEPQFLKYDLRDASCRLLNIRGRPLQARLDGLKYSMLDVELGQPAPVRDARRSSLEKARAMLELIQDFHGRPAQFAPGPFKELEAHLHATGQEGLAREVARERRRSELAAERANAATAVSFVRAYIRSAVLWSAGYGYSAMTALWLSVATLTVFILTARFAPGFTGQFCENTQASCAPSPGALLRVALDNFIPIVKLGLAEELRGNGTIARWMLAALRMAGWLLTTLIVVSWSGLMRKQ